MVYSTDTAAQLAEIGDVVTHFDGRAPVAMVEKILPEVAIIIGQTDLPQARLCQANNLQAIINVKGNWENNLDYQYAHDNGIWVLSAAPAMAKAVAEFCLGQAIALGRNLIDADQLFRDGKENYGIHGNAVVTSLYDATIGLIGCGNLGKELIPLLQPFTPQLKIYDPYLTDNAEVTDLESLLATSDFVFVLAGVTTENENFLSKEKLQLLKDGACVILASRAEVVDFAALVDLANRGKIKVSIDVYPQEPYPHDNELRTQKNIHFSAHLAGGIIDSYQRIQTMMLADIKAILQGKNPSQLQRANPELAAISRSR